MQGESNPCSPKGGLKAPPPKIGENKTLTSKNIFSQFFQSFEILIFKQY